MTLLDRPYSPRGYWPSSSTPLEEYATPRELQEFLELTEEITKLAEQAKRLTALRHKRHALRDRWKKRKRHDNT